MKSTGSSFGSTLVWRRLLVLAMGMAAGTSSYAYQLLVCETEAGSVGSALWGGIQRYEIATPGGAAVAGNGIPTAQLSDPAGLAFNASGELFVGNRHGNSAASSVSRFNYNGGTDTYDPNGTITGNSLFGAHGLNFGTTGELFVSNVNGPISRFTFSGGVAVANGTMGSGPSRDVFLSADGLWAYVSQGVSGDLLKYDVSTNALVNTFAIAGAGGLHNGTWLGSDLYVAGFSSGAVHRITFDANGDVTGSSVVASVNAAISVAFSPDGMEMYVGGHTTGLVSRFLNVGGSWVANGVIDAGHDVGDIIVTGDAVPEPASMAALSIGALALLRRKRK